MVVIVKALIGFIFISGILVLAEATINNYVSVGDTFNFTFTYAPKTDALVWKRNTTTNLYTVALNKSTGNDCLPSSAISPTGFQFYCEDNGGKYTLGITSKFSDIGNNFTTSKGGGPLSYIPFDDTINLDTLITCNKPGSKIKNFLLSFTTVCTNSPVISLKYKSIKPGAVEKDLLNPVATNSNRCNEFTNLQSASFTYNINQSHHILSKFDSSDNGFQLIVVISFPGTTLDFTVTNSTYIVPLGPSSDGCVECVPVFVCIGVGIGIGIIVIVIWVMKKKKKKKKKENSNQTPMTEKMSKP